AAARRVPLPDAGGFAENRVRLATTETQTGNLAVPVDAIVPEAGTGTLREVGPGKTARAKLTYRVLGSAYHDGSRMTATDALYGLAFAFRSGGGRGGEGGAGIGGARARRRERAGARRAAAARRSTTGAGCRPRTRSTAWPSPSAGEAGGGARRTPRSAGPRRSCANGSSARGCFASRPTCFASAT